MTTRILLLEDDRALSMGIEYMLKDEGFTVDSTYDIKSASENFSNTKYDLLILDIMLPDGTGYEFCENVRKTSMVPVVFLTALDEEVNVVMGLDIGADDYITKPFRSKELLARINSILRRRSGITASSVVRKDDKSLSYQLDDTEIDLTSTENRLLHMLVTNKGQVMTREQLLEQIWDTHSSFVDDNTLSVYIKRLRGKLGDAGNFIKTVRGTGYRWEE